MGLIVISGWQLHRLQVLRTEAYRLDGKLVRARVSVGRGDRLELRQVWVNRGWVDVRTLQISFSLQNSVCVSHAESELVGQLLLQKPVFGWNRHAFNSMLDTPVFQFRCKGWMVGAAPLAIPVWEQWRSGWVSALSQAIPATWGGDTLYVLITGDQSRVSPELRSYLQQSFVWHICVVSGAHVVWVFGIVMGVWKWGTLPLRWAHALLAVGLDWWMMWGIGGAFLFWWGPSASAIRGLGFYVAVRLLNVHGSELSKWVRVMMVIFGILALCPELWMNVGFWMSVYASVCFVLLHSNFQRAPRWLKMLGVNTLMNICMCPWVLSLSGYVIWPWLVLSPIAFVQVGVGIAATLLTMIFDIFTSGWLEFLGVWAQQWMVQSFKMNCHAPNIFFLMADISEEWVWLISFACVGCLAFWRYVQVRRQCHFI